MRFYRFLVQGYCLLLIIIIGSLLLLPPPSVEAGWPAGGFSHIAPKVAVLYLGSPLTAPDIRKLAQFDVVALHMLNQGPFAAEIRELRRLNPDIILLAYIPSEEFPIGMYRSWDSNPNGLWHRLLAGITDEMWLWDGNGNHTSFWPDNWLLNVTNHGAAGKRWNEYLSDFVAREILSTGLWDGIFYDNTWTSVSWINGSRMDANRDGKNDTPGELDRAWEQGMKTLFALTRQKAGREIIIVGNGDRGFNGDINGLYIEDFTLNTFAGWDDRMKRYESAASEGREGRIAIVGNTSLGRDERDYRIMRYGLTSALMEDGYHAFDGKDSHAEIWWYDEYGAKLGRPITEAISLSGLKNYTTNEVWRRDYETGIALVNPSAESVSVDLGGEYEKLIGAQDPAVNNGAIVNSVTVPARDGLIMLKTFRTLKNVVFSNGSFVRFFTRTGARARNGFFAFEENFAGGAKLYTGDLDGDLTEERIVVTGAKLEIFDSRGQRWFSGYPFGANYRGEINIAVGRLGSDTPRLVAAPSRGGRIVVYNYHGGLIADNLYPLGKKYAGGFSVAIGATGPKGAAEIALATISARQSEVLLYDFTKNKIRARFAPYGKFGGSVSVTAGDFDGDQAQEIATIASYNRRPLVRTFSGAGKKLTEFAVSGIFSAKPFALTAVDINQEGKKEIVVMTND